LFKIGKIIIHLNLKIKKFYKMIIANALFIDIIQLKKNFTLLKFQLNLFFQNIIIS
jgi:hypothetical protein